jgi:hypothetical protein
VRSYLDVTCAKYWFEQKQSWGFVLADADQYADLTVTNVVKGSEPAKTIHLKRLRWITKQEQTILTPVEGAGIHNHLSLRIAYTRRSGDHLHDLEIAPMGVEPRFLKAYRAATRSTTRPDTGD